MAVKYICYTTSSQLVFTLSLTRAFYLETRGGEGTRRWLFSKYRFYCMLKNTKLAGRCGSSEMF